MIADTNPESRLSPGGLDLAAYAGQYLTFQLSREQYGISILKITEIIGMVDVTRVPRCPTHVLGVINLRGKIVPLIDLRMRFGLPKAEYDDKTCIIVASVKSADQKMVIGMVVDTVVEVVQLHKDQLARAPEYGLTLDTTIVLGIGKLPNKNVAILLDVDRILESKDVEAITEARQASA